MIVSLFFPFLFPCCFFLLLPCCPLAVSLLFSVGPLLYPCYSPIVSRAVSDCFPSVSIFFPCWFLFVSSCFPCCHLVVPIFRCLFHFFVRRLQPHPKDQHACTDRELKTNLPDGGWKKPCASFGSSDLSISHPHPCQPPGSILKDEGM